MAVRMNGPMFRFDTANKEVTLNCPIRKIVMLAGSAINLIIDGTYVYFTSGRVLEFCNIKGYPGGVLKVPDTITGEAIFSIEEIGDVLNPNYFKEDIRNWNGQGATAAVSEAPKKAPRAKKEEVEK